MPIALTPPLSTRNTTVLYSIDEDDSDLTITCGQQSYILHKSVACSNSSLLRRACETQSINNKFNSVELLEEDPLLIHKMFTFFYNSSYTIDRNDTPDLAFSWDIDTHARMYDMGERFGAPKLVKYAARRFRHAMKDCEQRALWNEWRRDRYLKELLAVIQFIWEKSGGCGDSLRRHVIRHLNRGRKGESPVGLRKWYAAILVELRFGREADFCGLVEEVEREHRVWIETWKVRDVRIERSSDEEDIDGVDLSVDCPSWLKGLAG